MIIFPTLPKVKCSVCKEEKAISQFGYLNEEVIPICFKCLRRMYAEVNIK